MSGRNRDVEQAMNAVDWILIAIAAALAAGFALASLAGWP